MWNAQRIAGLGLIVAISASVALAQNPALKDRAPTVQAQVAPGHDGKVMAATAFPTGKLKGLHVRNPKGETIGSVDDLVINVAEGKVNYVAMSVGGVLGIGDKLFAVPFREMKFNHGKDEMFFVLDVSKEKLEKAPGFDKNNWPDFADPKWRDQIDKYYRKSTDERTTRAPSDVRTD
jgi:sporulation protein YlmC with PRC-barrel domain